LPYALDAPVVAAKLAALRQHLAKRGFGDIEVNMTVGYDEHVG
jgi:hypothetical protein